MNIATVFKQSTTTSARMSTNIHCTELSALSSIQIDHLNRKKISGQPHQSAISKQIKSTVLMESSSVLNIVQEPDNERRRRHSLSLRDERLLKILSAPPDEPLYINSTANNKAILNGDNNTSGDNLLMQYEVATSSITAVADYENENLPPTDKNAVANTEDGILETMSSTPQRGFSAAAWSKLQRDLADSPSASCRMRAIRAINSPANGNYYSRFDVTNDENSNDEVECSIEQPRTIEEVMKNVIVYVEYRSDTENRTIGIKHAIANLGAKVNDRLLRNTTHVVFKDGLQSTYNKAKSWNIPIVSILWIEACKKHLILMNPSAYPIPNIEKYENPFLYEKTKRHKYIQPDTLMKNLHRPIPKSKILAELKKTNDSSTILSSSINKTVNCSPNVSQRPLSRKTTVSGSAKTNPTRKSVAKKLDEKPTNTISSMFKKQLEKSRIDNSQLNGTIGDPEASEKTNSGEEKKANTEQTSDITLCIGSSHKRLTRRSSMTMTMQTPKKSVTKSAEVAVSTPSSTRKRHCTMLTASIKPSIEEEQDSNIEENSIVGTDIAAANKTLHKSIAMDVCNESKSNAAIKCNTKVRQLLNNELSTAPRPNELNGSETFVPPKTRLTRRTTYASQPMDETTVQNSSSTPASLKRRLTMNINAGITPRSTKVNPPELVETKSCDAILTPTVKTKESNAFSTTPLIQSLSKTHLDHIRSSTKKSLLDEYNNTFSSKKTPMTSDKRKTIANITMDIIKQRIENINRNASFNRSTNDLFEDSLHNDVKATPPQIDCIGKATPSITSTPANDTPGNGIQLKPLKRKLFAPPSLFPENSPILTATPEKTDKKTVKQKRKRDDLMTRDKLTKSDEKKTLVQKVRPNRKTTHSRRSTMLFETPVRKANSDTNANAAKMSASASSTVTSTAINCAATPGLVFTSMHQPQIEFITEAVKKLGKFKLEDKVGAHTTHLVALDGRRTVNILRGLIRGVWILQYDWILKSVEANRWQSELEYEMRHFSKAVEINRIERQAFGPKYKMDIFRNVDTVYLSPKCTCKSLKELVGLCYGKVTTNHLQARYIITENYRANFGSENSIQMHPNWILDSISTGNVANITKYVLKPNI